MAILTPKGVRAPHQLKGRRNVRISRDRRGCGNDDIEQLKDEVIGDLTSLETSEKTNLVGSINEVANNVNEVANNVNEVAKITLWSTEEKVIGKWIDGKPIYRQVLNINEINPVDWGLIPETDNLNIKKIIKASLMGTDNSYTDCEAYAYVTRFPDGKFRFRVYGWSFVATTLILEYTKTTD